MAPSGSSDVFMRIEVALEDISLAVLRCHLNSRCLPAVWKDAFLTQDIWLAVLIAIVVQRILEVMSMSRDEIPMAITYQEAKEHDTFKEGRATKRRRKDGPSSKAQSSST